MKKFLTVLLVIAVMFTFSFGSAFGAMTSTEVTEVKTALMTKSAELQTDVEKQGAAYLAKMTFDSDGVLTAIEGTAVDATITDLITKAVVEARMADVIDECKTAIDGFAKSLQGVISTTTDPAATVNGEVGKLMASYTDLLGNKIVKDYVFGADSVDMLAAQYDVNLKDANDAMSAYLATLDKYSDNINEKAYATTTNLATGTAAPDYGVATLTDVTNTSLTAKELVKAVIEKQANAVNDAKLSVKTTSTDLAASLKAFAAAKKIVKDVVGGHKITTSENYYVEAVPTIDELKADTTLAGKKTNAIKQMKANLTAAVIAMETDLNNELSNENKQAKPDATKVRNIQEALAALDAQVAATEEVFTALINYCDTTGEVDGVLNGIVSTTNASFTNLTDYATFVSGGSKAALENNLKTTKDVKALKAEADLLTLQKDVNGEPLYDAVVLADQLADLTKKLYRGATDLTAAKTALQGVGQEVALVAAKKGHIDYMKGTAGYKVEDKNGNEITKVNAAGAKAWNKADATRTAADATVMTNYKAEEASSITANVYDKAQAAELKALVADTEAAIKAAKTVKEVKEIFAAAQVKYEAIATTAKHNADWADGATIGKAYIDGSYEKQLDAYADYAFSKVDAKDYLATKDELKAAAKAVIFEAYTAAELPAKFDAAKAVFDGMKTKAEVNAEKAKVEALVAAIPNTPALADKATITAAADALKAYKDIPGSEPSINNEAKLVAAKTAYEKLAAEELDAAYKALNGKTITTADAAAVEALRALYDAHADYCSDYDVSPTKTTIDKNVEDIEKALSDAKVAAAKEMMIKLPANPTTADKAQVEAARAAYEALTLAEQEQIVGSPAYKNLIDAEEALGISIGNSVKELKITAGSSAKKGSITVKWTVVGDTATTDGYQIWKSTKKNKGFRKAFTTTKKSYKNTKGLKAGTRYYYKVRAYQVVDGKNVYSDWSNKAIRIAK